MEKQLPIKKMFIFGFIVINLFFYGFIQFDYNAHGEKQQINNLKAFSRLYGYIKYFHPSDEVSEIDWDKFAVYGVEKIKTVKNDEELKNTLKELFLPIAPTAQIYSANEKPKDISEYFPKDTTGLKVVAWQHMGVGISHKSNIYKSIRINRGQVFPKSPNEPAFGLVSETIDAKEFAGKEVKLKAFVKCEVNKDLGRGHLWLRVDKENKQTGFFDNMDNRPIKLNSWREYEINGVVDEDAVRIVFGSFLKGFGKLWIDKVQLFVRDNESDWKLVKVGNPSFEDTDENGKPKLWWVRSSGYNYSLDQNEKIEGSKSLLIEKSLSQSTPILFEKYPKVGEVIKEELAPNLFCKIPLALYGDSSGTLGKNGAYPIDSLLKSLSLINIGQLNANNEAVRLADVVIAWNVFQHFYPYFDVVKVDWSNVLTETLNHALQNKTTDQFYNTLRKMVAKLQDGHGYINYKPEQLIGGLPVRVEWVENNIVITASTDTVSFKKGDIIKSIDGKTGEEELREEEKYVSGSPQLKRYRTLNQYGGGSLNSIAKLELIRNNKTIALDYKRAAETRGFFLNQISEFDFPKFKKFDDGIYYINAYEITNKDFEDSLQQLTNAKGIIFDKRWDGVIRNTKENFQPHEIIPFLIDSTIHSATWSIPNVIYPDRKAITFSGDQWTIQPKVPRIKSKLVFINVPSVVSYGESYMGILENYKLAEFVGESTAGTNGNVNFIPLPGGFEIMFTGMKVLKHDGSQHHLIGVKPTYPVERTIKAVKEGRDEYLEKAIEVIKKSIK